MKNNPLETADLVTFTEEIPNRKLRFFVKRSLKISIVMTNNFYYFINCVKIKRVTIYIAKSLDVVALKVLLAIYCPHNFEYQSIKFLTGKMKLTVIRAIFPGQDLQSRTKYQER